MIDPRVLEILWRIYERCWVNIGKDERIETLLAEMEEEYDDGRS